MYARPPPPSNGPPPQSQNCGPTNRAEPRGIQISAVDRVPLGRQSNLNRYLEISETLGGISEDDVTAREIEAYNGLPRTTRKPPTLANEIPNPTSDWTDTDAITMALSYPPRSRFNWNYPQSPSPPPAEESCYLPHQSAGIPLPSTSQQETRPTPRSPCPYERRTHHHHILQAAYLSDQRESQPGGTGQRHPSQSTRLGHHMYPGTKYQLAGTHKRNKRVDFGLPIQTQKRRETPGTHTDQHTSLHRRLGDAPGGLPGHIGSQTLRHVREHSTLQPVQCMRALGYHGSPR